MTWMEFCILTTAMRWKVSMDRVDEPKPEESEENRSGRSEEDSHQSEDKVSK